MKPCPFRHASDEGHILCDKIKAGDRAVSPNTCRACPIAHINCAHLRATLDHQARPPLVVRYGNGKTEIWDDLAPPIALQRAACAAKVTPITSRRECAGCALRQALVDSQPSTVTRQPSAKPRVLRRIPATVPLAQPTAHPAPPTPTADARTNSVAQKIIKLQEWLAKQSAARQNRPDDDERAVLPMAVGAPRVAATPRSEEKRVGWTD